MDFFGKCKQTFLLIGGSALAMMILVWTFFIGGDKGLREGFVPVNDQIQQILDSTAVATALPAPIASSGTRVDAAIPSPTKTEAPADPNQITQEDNGSKKEPKAAASNTGDKLNVNTATLEQLDALPGIGPSKAQAIITYRSEKGSFRHVDDLLKVKGIGEKILEKLKPHIYVSDP